MDIPKLDTSVPVQYEQFAREAQNILHQDNYDGFRLEAGKNVTKNMQAAHSLFLGTQLREGGYIYQFGPQYQSEDGSKILYGRIGLDGGVNARLIQRFKNGLDFKANINSSLADAQRNAYDFTCEYSGRDWASSAKLVHQGTWILNGAFSQVITKNLQAGCDLTYITANGASIGSIGYRFTKGKNVFTSQVTRQPDFKSFGRMTHQIKAQYVRHESDRVSLAAEYEVGVEDKESALRFGYEHAFRHARVQGCVDTAGKVGMSLQNYSGFGVSATIDYLLGDYKFGFMMHMMPPPEQQ